MSRACSAPHWIKAYLEPGDFFFEPQPNQAASIYDSKATLAEIERVHIELALKEEGGDVAQAAKRTGRPQEQSLPENKSNAGRTKAVSRHCLRLKFQTSVLRFRPHASPFQSRHPSEKSELLILHELFIAALRLHVWATQLL